MWIFYVVYMSTVCLIAWCIVSLFPSFVAPSAGTFQVINESWWPLESLYETVPQLSSVWRISAIVIAFFPPWSEVDLFFWIWKLNFECHSSLQMTRQLWLGWLRTVVFRILNPLSFLYPILCAAPGWGIFGRTGLFTFCFHWRSVVFNPLDSSEWQRDDSFKFWLR